MVAQTAGRALRRLWDGLFGPPRIRELPDGTLHVRLFGRAFVAADYEGLFRAVSRERERLVHAVRKAHESASDRAYFPLTRLGPGELYQRDVRRLEDRLALYNEFLGHLVRRMQRAG
jgi:hypothetical protein